MGVERLPDDEGRASREQAAIGQARPACNIILSAIANPSSPTNAREKLLNLLLDGLSQVCPAALPDRAAQAQRRRPPRGRRPKPAHPAASLRLHSAPPRALDPP